jgi:hypothetical protein
MDFDEIKKVWDANQQQFAYTIDEHAMHRYIRSRRNSVGRTANITEWITITVNLAVGTLMLVNTLTEGSKGIIYYALILIMYLIAGIVALMRHRRKRAERDPGKSMTKDLDDAIATATYQVRLSSTIRWCSLVIALLAIVSLWNKVRSVELSIAATVFFVVVLLASQWEHNWYLRRRKKLQLLRTKLTEP